MFSPSVKLSPKLTLTIEALFWMLGDETGPLMIVEGLKWLIRRLSMVTLLKYLLIFPFCLWSLGSFLSSWATCKTTFSWLCAWTILNVLCLLSRWWLMSGVYIWHSSWHGERRAAACSTVQHPVKLNSEVRTCHMTGHSIQSWKVAGTGSGRRRAAACTTRNGIRPPADVRRRPRTTGLLGRPHLPGSRRRHMRRWMQCIAGRSSSFSPFTPVAGPAPPVVGPGS